MQLVSTETVYSRVYAEVRDALMSGAFQPGELVTIRSLAQRLGTSPMPIRDALRRLLAENALETQPNRTVRIPVHNATSTKDLLEARCALEGMAAAKAAHVITPAELSKIEKIHAAALRALAKEDTAEYLRQNTLFHRTLYAGAHSNILLPLIESLWLQYAPVMALSMRTIEATQKDWRRVGDQNHQEIIKALRNRDARAVRRAVEADIMEPTKLPGFWNLFTLPGYGTAPKRRRRSSSTTQKPTTDTKKRVASLRTS
ncbi:GntR family transcriptional regulator [Roseiterribacter gracilis]|uniref:GntR family transcriptional regulator n=1 Tax=Roseiterribacter gracilis TaxID=2812848 RepID=A0A8S8X9X9_9PROT|nr:GntR family transcriptional regulator [Rhodospirillales bacterium TMPK1]